MDQKNPNKDKRGSVQHILRTCLWVLDPHDGWFGTGSVWHAANDVLQLGFIIMTAVCVCVCESDGCSGAMKDAPYHPQYLLACLLSWRCSSAHIIA